MKNPRDTFKGMMEDTDWVLLSPYPHGKPWILATQDPAISASENMEFSVGLITRLRLDCGLPYPGYVFIEFLTHPSDRITSIYPTDSLVTPRCKYLLYRTSPSEGVNKNISFGKFPGMGKIKPYHVLGIILEVLPNTLQKVPKISSNTG